MQGGMNSLININPSSSSSNSSSHISLQDLHHQIQTPPNSHFDPSSNNSSINDDFLEQMLSTIPNSSSSCSWADLTKSPWDFISNKPIDLSDETAPSNNVGFHSNFDESLILASKLRHHQISSGGSAPSPTTTAAKLILHQQLMMAAGLSQNDVVVDGSSFKSPPQGGDGAINYNGFGGGSMQQSQQHFHNTQNFGNQTAVMSQPQVSGSNGGGGAAAQPRQRVRARRGQATDPHSIAERLRRERIAERMKALQELVPNANKTDKASMLDEIIDYVKFIQLQVKVLSMSRLGGAAAVAPLVADISSEGGGDCIQANGGSLPRTSNGNQTSSSNDSLTVTEHQVAKLMEEDMGSAMQYLQGKGLCLMPISLATAISTATCHTRSNPSAGHHNLHHSLLQSNGVDGGPSSPSMSVLTVQSATMGGNGGTDASVKDAASVSKP